MTVLLTRAGFVFECVCARTRPRGFVSTLQGKKGDLDKAYRVDKDLAAAEAKRLIAMERRQEDDAYLLSREYDDDYDDQVCPICADGAGVLTGL